MKKIECRNLGSRLERLRLYPDIVSPALAMRLSLRAYSYQRTPLKMLVFRNRLHRTHMAMSSVLKVRLNRSSRKRKNQTVLAFSRLCCLILAASAATDVLCLAFFCSTVRAQQTDQGSAVVVQPGAPGKPSKRLPPSTTAKLPPPSQAEAEFMRGMIMHHAQAVEMTALIWSHTENKDLRLLGARISNSQSDEIRFMRRWLAARGEPGTMPAMAGHPMALMPGMLTPEQMEALRKAKAGQFDHLFLTGMIQHHDGALTMVKDLFDTAGAGQDAELFDFATDADNTQRAEIRIMQSMLENKTSEEKR
jgi:uncharacterized protein (DUF305 family)